MKSIALPLSLGLLVAPLHAQATTPLAFRLPASARALAMGDVGVAGRDDDVLFYNPAQLAVGRGTSMSYARMSAIARGGTMSTNLRLGRGGVGIGVNYLEYRTPPGVYPLTRDDILDQNQLLGTSTMAVVGYSQAIRNLRVGAALKYGVDEVGVDRHRALVADVGLAKDFAQYFTAGLSVQHLGQIVKPDRTNVRPPIQATLGVAGSGPVGPLDVVVTTAASAMRTGHVTGALGAEVGWSWLNGYSVQGRAGVRYPEALGEPSTTAGVGFVADRVAYDLAAEWLRGNRLSYRFGVRVR